MNIQEKGGLSENDSPSPQKNVVTTTETNGDKSLDLPLQTSKSNVIR